MKKPAKPLTYSPMDVLLASPTEPLSVGRRTHQTMQMWQALAALETAPAPDRNDWRICSDAVNLLGTLVAMGELADESSLLDDAKEALLSAGKRAMEGGPIRLDGPGIHAVRAVLEDYATALSILPARTVIKAHRQTEKTMATLRKASAANRAPGVKVMTL